MEVIKRGWTHIYGLFDPRDGVCRYIGKSDNPRIRKQQHINEALRCGRDELNRKQAWLMELVNGGLFPDIEVLAMTPNKFWRKAEAEIMEQYPDIYNAAPGGGGPLDYEYLINHAWANSTRRARLSEHNRRRWAIPGYREKVSANISAAYKRPDVARKVSEKQKRSWADSPWERHQQVIDRNNEMWADPEYRQFMVDINKEIWSDPERLARQSEITSELWQDPEYREKVLSAISTPEAIEMRSEVFKKMWSDPEYRERKISQLQEMWQDPEFRERHAEGMAAAGEQISQSLKEHYKDPENRRRVSEWATEYMKNPEVREHLSQVATAQWEDPEFREKQARARNRGKLVPDVRRAAERIGVKEITIYKYCHQGKLGRKIDKSWVITDEDIEAFLARRSE